MKKFLKPKKSFHPKQRTKMLHPILIAVQKSPGNSMSDEENTRYSKQIQTKNQELYFKCI